MFETILPILNDVKVATGLYVNWDSLVKVDDIIVKWLQSHKGKSPEGFILKTEAEAVYTLSIALRKGGREFLISKNLYSILNALLKKRERRLGGNGYHMGRALHELGLNPLVSYPFRPSSLMEASPEFQIAVGNQFKKPREAVRKDDPEVDHIIFEFKKDKSRGINVTGRHILSWDLMSTGGVFDCDFLRYASNPKFTDILAISYAHLLLPQHKSKTDKIVEYLDRIKRPKVNLELGEGSEESMKYAIDSLINHNCLDSLSMNEMECKKYFKAESTALKDLTVVTNDKIKEYGINRICVHSQDFAFSISKNNPQKEFQAMQMGHRAASALTMGGIKSFWHKTESLKQSRITKMEQRIGEHVLCVVPAKMNPEPKILTGLGDTFAAIQAVAAFS